jgi:hypothetical protein
MACEKGACGGAAVADPAVHDDLLVLRQISHPIAEFLERDEIRAGDRLLSVLRGSSYVEKKKVLSRLHLLVQLTGADVFDSKIAVKHFCSFLGPLALADLFFFQRSRTMDTVRGISPG